MIVVGGLGLSLVRGDEGQPNLVVFVSDDMGWQDVGYHGGNGETPVIDQLVKEGVELDRFYVWPICSPTRAALMTGRSPLRFGIVGPIGRDGSVPEDELFLPEVMKSVGYQTWMIGKWHLGDRADSIPKARGFDHFYGFLGGSVDYYSHQRGRNLDWQRNGKVVREEGYSTQLFGNEAVRLLKERNREKPFFLYLPFNAPHSPAQAPEKLIEKYRAKGMTDREAPRAAAIEAMDQEMGRVLKVLDEEGLKEETLVMFFCDNGGGARGRGRTGENFLLGGKGQISEGGVRVPAVIRWPGKIEAGSKCERIVSVHDLLPTLTEALGIEFEAKKALDGQRMWSAISHGKEVERSKVVFADQNGGVGFGE